MMPDPKKIMGKRIRLARKMAGLTQERLLENASKPGASKSMVSNWENGRYRPNRDQIEAIAAATGTSPSWIERGYGPIGTDNRDIQAIRHQNLGYHWHEREIFKLRTGSHSEYLSEERILAYLCDPRVMIPDEAAREMERALGKPEGWMDEQHVENDPVLESLPPDAREVLHIYSELPQKYRPLLIGLIQSLKTEIEKMERRQRE